MCEILTRFAHEAADHAIAVVAAFINRRSQAEELPEEIEGLHRFLRRDVLHDRLVLRRKVLREGAHLLPIDVRTGLADRGQSLGDCACDVIRASGAGKLQLQPSLDRGVALRKFIQNLGKPLRPERSEPLVVELSTRSHMGPPSASLWPQTQNP